MMINVLANEQYERLVLATISARPSLLSSVALVLSPHHFSNPHLAEVYEVMIKRGATDASAIVPQLSPSALDGLGGAAGVCQILQLAPVNDISPYVGEIVQAFMRRETHRALNNAAARVASGDDVPEVIGALMERVSKHSAFREVTAESAPEMLESYVNGIFASRATGFGIPTLDSAIGGIRSGRLHIIAGQSGGGKTTLMVQAALQALRAGRTVVFVSAEMTPEQIVSVAISHLAGMSLSPDSLAALARKGEKLQLPAPVVEAVQRFKSFGNRFIIVEKSLPSVADAHLLCKRYLTGKNGLLIVDYLQIMAAPAGAANREQEVSRNAIGLKSVANSESVAVITGSQLNREGSTRESEAPLHHSDVLLRIEPSEPTAEGAPLPCVIRIIKNRGGATGTRNVMFARQKAGFFAVAS